MMLMVYVSPAHFPADVVVSILENKVMAGFALHKATPVPLTARENPLCVVCTTPFIAEFKVAAAMWEPRLFPICSPALLTLDSLVRYAVPLKIQKMSGGESEHCYLCHGSFLKLITSQTGQVL